MVWLHLKDEIKKKNQETLGSNFRGYTHCCIYMCVCTQKKEEEEGFSVCVWAEFPVGIFDPKNWKSGGKMFTCDSPSVTRLDLSSVRESDWRSSAINFFSSSHSSSCLKTLISSASPRSSPSLLPFTCGIFVRSGKIKKKIPTRHTLWTHTRGSVLDAVSQLFRDNKSRPKLKIRW